MKIRIISKPSTKFAEGGDIQQTDNGLNIFGAGDTHENNALGGIPQGYADDGSQNLVEEGETKFSFDDGDYVFSQRNPDYSNKEEASFVKDLLKKNHLPATLYGKSWAEMSIKLQEENKGRENQASSNDTMNELESRLRDCQEEYNSFKEDQRMNDEFNNLSTEEKSVLLQQMSQQDQIDQQQVNQGQGLTPEEQAILAQQQGLPMMSPEEQQMVAQEQMQQPGLDNMDPAMIQQLMAQQQMSNGGEINIKKSHEGLFTQQANRAGMGVQEFARHVLANKDRFSPSTVKRAVFARNATKWHANGGRLAWERPEDWGTSYKYILDESARPGVDKYHQVANFNNIIHANGDNYEYAKGLAEWLDSLDADEFNKIKNDLGINDLTRSDVKNFVRFGQDAITNGKLNSKNLEKTHAILNALRVVKTDENGTPVAITNEHGRMEGDTADIPEWTNHEEYMKQNKDLQHTRIETDNNGDTIYYYARPTTTHIGRMTGSNDNIEDYWPVDEDVEHGGISFGDANDLNEIRQIENTPNPNKPWEKQIIHYYDKQKDQQSYPEINPSNKATLYAALGMLGHNIASPYDYEYANDLNSAINNVTGPGVVTRGGYEAPVYHEGYTLQNLENAQENSNRDIIDNSSNRAQVLAMLANNALAFQGRSANDWLQLINADETANLARRESNRKIDSDNMNAINNFLARQAEFDMNLLDDRERAAKAKEDSRDAKKKAINDTIVNLAKQFDALSKEQDAFNVAKWTADNAMAAPIDSDYYLNNYNPYRRYNNGRN